MLATPLVGSPCGPCELKMRVMDLPSAARVQVSRLMILPLLLLVNCQVEGFTTRIETAPPTGMGWSVPFAFTLQEKDPYLNLHWLGPSAVMESVDPVM